MEKLLSLVPEADEGFLPERGASRPAFRSGTVSLQDAD